MSLRARLQEILPDLLPRDSEHAIKGTELIRLVRSVLGDEYSDRSYRSHFSFMVLDPDSCLARVENGQGYYFKDASQQADARSLHPLFEAGAASKAEGYDGYHKALALVVRSLDTAGLGVFVYPAQDDSSWLHPDVVAVQWPGGHWVEDAFVMNEEVCRAWADSGESPLSYRSICLSFAEESNRRALFRALAAGLWAQECELVLVGEALAQEEEDELRLCASQYGIGISQWLLPDGLLERLPRADEIFRAGREEALALVEQMHVRRIAVPRYRSEAAHVFANLDQTDLQAMYYWTWGCLDRGRVEPYEFRVSVS